MKNNRATQALAALKDKPPQTEVEIMRGLTMRVTSGGVVVARLHYSANPERDPDLHPEWKIAERKAYPSQAAWDREQEIIDEAGGGELAFAEVLLKYWHKIVIEDPHWRPDDPEFVVRGGFDYGKINATALVKKVIEGGVSNPKSLADTLPNPAWKAFAAAFDFTDSGAASPSSASSVATTTGDYVEQQLESNEGQQDPGVQLALYFQRVAPTVTSSYGILGNENLLEVVQTIFGLASTTTSSQIDAEANSVGKLVPISELQDPTKVKQLVERFTAAYDSTYGPTSGSSSSLTVVDGSQPTTVSAASSVLADVVSSNASARSALQSSTLFSPALLESLQGATLGG